MTPSRYSGKEGETMAENLSLPIDIKPFRARTKEAWASFLAGEGELCALMDQKGGDAVRKQLIERCSALLSPAFAQPAFELGYNGEKYELILSPEADRTRLFQLAYFRRQAPNALLDRWNILVGRPRSQSFGLRMFGQELTLADVHTWVEKTENGGVTLRVYCEKLLFLKKENENQVYSILYILLDQALGELVAMRHVDGLEILDAPGAGAGIRLDRLAEYVATEIDPEGWASSGDSETACERYTAYRGEPSQEEDWPPRADVYAGGHSGSAGSVGKRDSRSGRGGGRHLHRRGRRNHPGLSGLYRLGFEGATGQRCGGLCQRSRGLGRLPHLPRGRG